MPQRKSVEGQAGIARALLSYFTPCGAKQAEFPPKDFTMYPFDKNWKVIKEADDREIRQIAKALKRFEARADKKDKKELRRYEKVLERGMRISNKDWL